MVEFELMCIYDLSTATSTKYTNKPKQHTHMLTYLQKVNRMLQQRDIIQRTEHQRPLFAFAAAVVDAAAIIGFKCDGMPGIVESVRDEDCLEGLFVFAVVVLLFAHGF